MDTSGATIRKVPVYAMLLFVCFSMGSCLANTSTKAGAELKGLKKFLQSWDTDKSTYYSAALCDLNSDGISEAIVYLTGDEWCGSGGCTTLILKQENNSWKIVTQVTINRPPIRILAAKSHGWHSVGVRVQGGGILRGYESELSFNGKSYPGNPSVPPAIMLTKKLSGKVVISDSDKFIPLNE